MTDSLPGPCFEKMPCGHSLTSVAYLCRECRDALADALEELIAVQNGPPLPTWKLAWDTAMDKSTKALAAIGRKPCSICPKEGGTR